MSADVRERSIHSRNFSIRKTQNSGSRKKQERERARETETERERERDAHAAFTLSSTLLCI